MKRMQKRGKLQMSLSRIFKSFTAVVLSVALAGCGGGGSEAGNYSGSSHSASASSTSSVGTVKLDQEPLIFEHTLLTMLATDGDFVVSLSGGSGAGAITYSSDNPAVALVDEKTGEVAVVGAGTATITVVKNGDATYHSASASYTLEVSKGDQLPLEFAAYFVPKRVTDEAFVVPLSGGSGAGAISYSSDNLAVALVDEETGEVSVVGAGMATIAAVKSGGATYHSVSASYVVDVNKIEQNILTFEDDSLVKLITDDVFVAPLSGGSGTGAITYSSDNPAVALVDEKTGEVAVVGAGMATITAVKNGDATYHSASARYTVEVIRPVSPGEYATVSGCTPFLGSEFSPLKIMFINLNSSPHFEALVEDAVENQFKVISPFDEFFSNMAFYKMNISGGEEFNCEGTSGSLGSSGFTCDDDKLHQAINAECTVDDIHGVIKIVIAESPYGGAAGEVVYVGDEPLAESGEEAIQWRRNTIVHEVSHNLGLADLYGGGFSTSGLATLGWPSSISREWLNLDGPGCPKWCDTFKPAFEYVESSSAQCHTLTTKEACMAFNRDVEGYCYSDKDGVYTCCGWSEAEDDYFGSQCTPVWGTEDIGLSCKDGAGCYYGGAYGINSWRPVKSSEDSIMYSPTGADSFDSVSEESIRQVLRCCASPEDSSSSCADFREKFMHFLNGAMLFKQRIGSCGVLPVVQ